MRVRLRGTASTPLRGERGDTEIDVARGGGDRDRLCGIEELQLDVEPGITKITLVLRDEDRRR
jgi:hypothetical protein